MSSTFSKLLLNLKEKGKNDTEIGTYFEQIVKIFLENDDIQSDQYSKVWHYSDWAKENTNYSPFLKQKQIIN